MFDISPDEIAQLNDTDLRSLVGRLCEAELARKGLPVSAVTYGGDQRAADGGLDVRVALPAGLVVDGFIPRALTGFQVKAEDMPRRKIATEMRPNGSLRPVIGTLVEEGGGYVIVSSRGAVADEPLRQRRAAMTAALTGVASPGRLHVDFYDRTRLASWVRLHPGLVTWVKERVGRALIGWRPYGPWAGGSEGVDAEYLLDNKLRLHVGRPDQSGERPLVEAIDALRDILVQPRKAVRLVGLSGVGKTRLVQALFDGRLGARPLPPSEAVYANLSDDPDPQPVGLASDLIANGRRAVLVVDNSPADLHRRLVERCSAPDSRVSVLTVEYDVREDQPEGTEVVTLDTSSPELIEKLIRRRFPHISEVDSGTIASFSGGNARVAIALAETIGRAESLAGVSDDDLFRRLFDQRRGSDPALMASAEACSLVYSFQGEALSGDEAELPVLAALADQRAHALFGHVSELLRRDLVQKRGVWRAILPHAVANRLAARALDNVPYETIERVLVQAGSDRLVLSFSRRLSFLHDHPKAVKIAEHWLAPTGLLGDPASLNEVREAMFRNAASAAPEAALNALGRLRDASPGTAAAVWSRHLTLLGSLAYDAALFERAAFMIGAAATGDGVQYRRKGNSEAFVSLFQIHLSGTHATIEQRLAVVERLLRSEATDDRSLGLAALGGVLTARGFWSGQSFQFGARPRNCGYRPQSREDVSRWYGMALALLERIAHELPPLKGDLRDLFARKFRGLWASGAVLDDVERLAKHFASEGFWRDGWIACSQTIRWERAKLPPDAMARLAALESGMRPLDLSQRVRAFALGDSAGLDVETIDDIDGIARRYERLKTLSRELGECVAVDEAVFDDLLPDILRGGRRAWELGQGLAKGSTDLRLTWSKLIAGLERLPPSERGGQLLIGFMWGVWERDRDLSSAILDEAVDESVLGPLLPALHMAGHLDRRGVDRLLRALKSGRTEAIAFRNLTLGRAIDETSDTDLIELLSAVSEYPDGLDVALEILFDRLYVDRSDKSELEPALLECGAYFLGRVEFKREKRLDEYRLQELAKACLIGNVGADIVRRILHKLMSALETHEIIKFDLYGFVSALIVAQPRVALDTLLSDPARRSIGHQFFEDWDNLFVNPANAISFTELERWCDLHPETRYPLAASIVTFSHKSASDVTAKWTDQALYLLTSAPDSVAVLKEFVARFEPRSGSGSLAAIIESNAGLLETLPDAVRLKMSGYIASAKAELEQRAEQWRNWETRRDHERDERFE